jgi:hypothetical protein
MENSTRKGVADTEIGQIVPNEELKLPDHKGRGTVIKS